MDHGAAGVGSRIPYHVFWRIVPVQVDHEHLESFCEFTILTFEDPIRIVEQSLPEPFWQFARCQLRWIQMKTRIDLGWKFRPDEQVSCDCNQDNAGEKGFHSVCGI
jgi:hypothetical protein